MPTAVSKPKPARAKAARAPRAARKPKPKPPPPEVHFRGRGPHKCTVVRGMSTRGVHPALKATFFPHWDFDAAVRTGKLTTFNNPPPQLFLATGNTKNRRRMPYSKKEGSRFDGQMTKALALVRGGAGVPLEALVDRNRMEHYLATRMRSPATEAARKFASRLMPETDTAIRFLLQHRLTPTRTQTPVGCDRIAVGTRVDLVCTDAAGAERVVEMKWSVCDGNGATECARAGPVRRQTRHPSRPPGPRPRGTRRGCPPRTRGR